MEGSKPGDTYYCAQHGSTWGRRYASRMFGHRVDQAILVTDERISGADTVATATYLASSINKIGEYDLILAGYQSQDGRTGQIGLMVAEKLGIPQITYVRTFYEEAGRLIGIRVGRDG